MLRIVVGLLKNNYSKDTEMDDISDNCIAEFIDGYEFESFKDLFLDIANTQVKSSKWDKRKDVRLNKIITFVYSTIMDLPDNKFEIKAAATKDFFSNVKDLIYGG